MCAAMRGTHGTILQIPWPIGQLKTRLRSQDPPEEMVRTKTVGRGIEWQWLWAAPEAVERAYPLVDGGFRPDLERSNATTDLV